MLNRRLLRIKVMQTLYGLHTSKQADLNLAIQAVEADLQPNLFLDEPENPKEMKQLAEQAKTIFKENFHLPGIQFPADSPMRLKNAVLKGVEAYRKGLQQDARHYAKLLKDEIDKIFFLYLQGLALVPALAEASEEELKRVRKVYPDKPTLTSQLNFAHNPYVQAMKDSESFKEACLRYHAGWDRDAELVWNWYKEVLKKNEAFKAYLETDSPDDEVHKEMLWTIGREVILKAAGIQAWFESEDLNWTENKSIVKGMLKKTLKEVEKEGFDLLELSVNWEEDQAFFETLFEETDISDAALDQYFSEALKNWDTERITATDRIILAMAIAEMIHFPSIPVKVSINEYIEISKVYSTPKSKQFINGLLDAVSQKLIRDGVIKKSGRGLIDNK